MAFAIRSVLCTLCLAACEGHDADRIDGHFDRCPSEFVGECAALTLPLDPSNRAAGELSVFAARAPAAQPASAQLWLLAGGPGQSGAAFRDAIPTLQSALPSTDIYVLEHRGVHRSSQLSCGRAMARASDGAAAILDSEWPDCVDELRATYGAELQYYSTTFAAHDLAAWIEHQRTPSQRVFLFGGSYGTYWALRYLQLFPNGADGVILDSVLTPDSRFISRLDEQFDQVGQALAAACQRQPECSKHFGPDPWSRVGEIIGKLAAGHCAELAVEPQALTASLASLIQSSKTRLLFFPVLHRLARCEAADRAAFTHMTEALAQAARPSAMWGSLLLQTHVVLSELWEHPAPDAAELARRRRAAVLWPAVSDSFFSRSANWPTYTPDRFVGSWPETDLPLLAMNGTLDPQTPVEKARALAEHFRAPHQHFIEIPNGPHIVLGSSLVRAGGPSCGMRLLAAFITDPQAPLDTSCLDDLVPLDLSVDSETASSLLGSDDAWN